jgi:hypothetical protein
MKTSIDAPSTTSLVSPLFLIPGLQEGAEALELVGLAASLRMIGTAGDIGISSTWDILATDDDTMKTSIDAPSTTSLVSPENKLLMKTDYKIDNPKEIISKRLPNITAFHENLDFTAGPSRD